MENEDERMADYIDREALKEAFWDACNNCLSEDDVADLIDRMPAADVAPVDHGRWVQEREIESHFLGSGTSFHCSACGRKAGHNQVKAYHYCPRCGAKMDKDGTQ